MTYPLLPLGVLAKSPVGHYQVLTQYMRKAVRTNILEAENEIERLFRDNPEYAFHIHQDGDTHAVTIQWKRRGMNEAQIRAALLTAYPGPSWRAKVEKMTQSQAYATYMRLVEAGRIKK